MQARSIERIALGIVVAVALAACSAGSTPERTPPPSSSAPVSPVGTSTPSPSTEPSVTPPAIPKGPLPSSGPAALDCVNGWTSPKPGTPGFTEPLGIIRRTTGVKGPLTVVEMRFFQGSESPPSDKGYLLVVDRWYIKLYADGDPAFQGRFLVEARRFGRGVSAVAPYDTAGWRSPDWVGFQFDSADTAPKAYPGLPGRWEGIPYDFVKGGAGLEIPGLPQQVVGCLAGT